MKIIAMEVEKPGLTSEDFRPFLKEESKAAWELYKKGIIREMFFRRDRIVAVLMLECESVEEAKEYLDTLPLVKENLIEFELIPLKPYTGFERLFQ